MLKLMSLRYRIMVLIVCDLARKLMQILGFSDPFILGALRTNWYRKGSLLGNGILGLGPSTLTPLGDFHPADFCEVKKISELCSSLHYGITVFWLASSQSLGYRRVLLRPRPLLPAMSWRHMMLHLLKAEGKWRQQARHTRSMTTVLICC